jgi:hypothetical protein
MKRWKITFLNSKGNRPSIFADFITFAEAASFAYLKRNSDYKGFTIVSVEAQ